MDIIEKGVKAAAHLVPPASGASETHVRRWRLWIAAATFLNAAGLSLHIALACGFAAPFYSGFAQADQFTDLKKEMNRRRVDELLRDLLDTKQKECTSTGEAKRLFGATYIRLRSEYYELTKREFQSLTCEGF